MNREPSTDWTHFSVDHLGLSLDVFADLSRLTVRRDGALTSLIQELGPVRLALWAGPDQTLDSWRQRLDVRGEARFDTEEVARVCGRAARKQVATVTQAEAVGLVPGPGATVGHLWEPMSTRVHVCVGFSHAGHHVLQCWIVDQDQRSAHAGDESSFFASLRCH